MTRTNTADAAGLENPKNKFASLELGRFMAATCVVLFHYTGAMQDLFQYTPFWGVFRFGHVGVEYFFILSGFLIYYIHFSDVGVAGAVRNFALKRVIRIYPTYWLVALAMLAAIITIPAIGSDRAVTSWTVVPDLLLLPFRGDEIIQVSWSLRHEIVFYAVFAVVIALGRNGWWIFMMWQAACLLHLFVFPAQSVGGDPLRSVVFGVYNLGFGAGVVIGWAARRVTLAAPRLWVMLGGTAVFVLVVQEWLLGRASSIHDYALGSSNSPLMYYAAFSVLIAGLVRIEIERPRASSGLMTMLGGSSYILYLTHGIVGSVAVRVLTVAPLRGWLPLEAVFVIMLISAVVFSWIAHAFEKPMLKYLNKKLRREPIFRKFPEAP